MRRFMITREQFSFNLFIRITIFKTIVVYRYGDEPSRLRDQKDNFSSPRNLSTTINIFG